MKDKLLRTIEKYYHIDKYYAISEEYLNREFGTYDPRIAVREIIENKINNIIEGNLPVENINLSNAISEYFKEFTIRDENYRQFPNYSYNITLNTIKQENMTIITSLKLVFSLLTNLYTVFFEDRYYISCLEFVPDLNIKNMSEKRMVNILSDYNGICDYDQVYFNILQQFMRKYFVAYNYIHHSTLFNSLIHFGAPWGKFEGFNYTVYDYLFNLDYDPGTYVVYPALPTLIG